MSNLSFINHWKKLLGGEGREDKGGLDNLYDKKNDTDFFEFFNKQV